MTARRSAIPVLGFRAGELYLAVAAEDVTAVEAARPDVVHIAEILDVEPAPPSEAQRVIHVRAADGARTSSAFLADPPVEVLSCSAGHIVPMAGNTPSLRLQPIMGFARIDERLHMLLDIEGIIRALRQERTGGES
jgi:chemotaxis signal transduction protein